MVQQLQVFLFHQVGEADDAVGFIFDADIHGVHAGVKIDGEKAYLRAYELAAPVICEPSIPFLSASSRAYADTSALSPVPFISTAVAFT